MNAPEGTLTNGPAAAAILASGIGSLALGLCTTLTQAISAVSAALNFYNPVGPLSGKTTLTVVVWLVAWAVCHRQWRQTQVDLAKVFTAALIMIALGLLGTFPVFFERFAG